MGQSLSRILGRWLERYIVDEPDEEDMVRLKGKVKLRRLKKEITDSR